MPTRTADLQKAISSTSPCVTHELPSSHRRTSSYLRIPSQRCNIRSRRETRIFCTKLRAQAPVAGCFSPLSSVSGTCFFFIAKANRGTCSTIQEVFEVSDPPTFRTSIGSTELARSLSTPNAPELPEGVGNVSPFQVGSELEPQSLHPKHAIYHTLCLSVVLCLTI